MAHRARGDEQLGSFRSEEVARYRFCSVRRSIAGQGAKLIRPDGTVADEIRRFLAPRRPALTDAAPVVHLVSGPCLGQRRMHRARPMRDEKHSNRSWE
jgi:hypothetical protein